jgi:hypothetical protein
VIGAEPQNTRPCGRGARKHGAVQQVSSTDERNSRAIELPFTELIDALSSSVAERWRGQRLKLGFDSHAEAQQLIVLAGQTIYLEPRRQTIGRKPRGNA